MYNNNENVRSHAEMMEEALKISPKARVRLKEDSDQWEIYIPTDCTANYELPATYEGTPAWEADKNPDSGYGNELARWGHKSFQYSNAPIEMIADYYNLQQDTAAADYRFLQEYLGEEEEGLTVKSLDYESEKHRAIYKRSRLRAHEASTELMAATKKAVNEKWDGQ